MLAMVQPQHLIHSLNMSNNNLRYVNGSATKIRVPSVIESSSELTQIPEGKASSRNKYIAHKRNKMILTMNTNKPLISKTACNSGDEESASPKFESSQKIS